MIRKHSLAAFSGATLFFAVHAAGAQAAMFVKTGSTSFNYNSFVPSTTSSVVDIPAPTFTVDPFDFSLGTLNSVQISWSTSIPSIVVQVGNLAGGGALNYSYGGSYYVSNVSYAGDGGGNGGGAGTNLSFTLPGDSESEITTFAIPNLPVSYDSGISLAISSGTPYTISYNGGANIGSSAYTNIASGAFAFNSNYTVTYNYTPNPVPSPIPFAGSAAAFAASRRLRKRINTYNARRQG